MVLALEVIVLAIAVTLLVQRSAGSDISPSPSIFTIIPPIEGLPTIPIDLIPPSPASLPNVSYIPPLLTPVNSAPPPSLPNAPPPLPDPEIAPPPLPNSPNNQDPINNSPQPVPVAPVSVTSPPPSSSPPEPPSANPVVPLAPISVITSPPPSSSLQVPPSVNPVVPPAPISVSTPPPSISLPEPPSVNPVTPIAPVSVATPPPSISPPEPPSFNPVVPRLEPPSSIPNIAPTNKAPPLKPHAPEPVISTISPPPPSPSTKIDGTPVASPPNRKFPPISPENSPPSKAPPIQKRNASSPHNNIAPLSPPDIRAQAPSSLPSKLPPRHHYGNKNITTPPPSSLLSPPPSLSLPPPPSERGAFSPKPHRNNSQKGHASPPSPSPLSNNDNLPGSSPPLAPPPGQTTLPIISPKASPSGPSPSHTKPPLVPPIHALPPPPPNQECSPLTCTAPYTNTPPGPPCGCVWPMQVEIRLGVTLYTFFPLVSELAQEISLGVFMRQSQVRIMGANSASQDPEKTIVLIDLVPLGEKFDNTTAFLTAERFWNKRVVIKSELFGNYEVLYVRYPGLPPSPPSSINVMDGESYPGHGDNTRSVKPLGVDVSGVRHKRNSLSGSVVAIVVMSASVLLILIISVYWVLISKKRHGQQESTPPPPPLVTLPFLSKPSGIAGANLGSIPSSETLSIKSCMVPYTGSAKTFSSSEINKATDNFDVTKIIGEGGFGRVYSGVLEDGTEVAVKVLKRDDQQGGREFLAEVEMLGRLHHRNLVKLIGICTEDRARCLVYELVRNGSVESHLHGVDKEIAPLDWGSRLKIALGAARGLAYLHEDSSPRVIHRDFKSSNILLEDDFTPKVSDFGLARTALDEENKHVSTRVMGTFGYVAPEYAMTGHLLVKSDVYSYGVVLLELLTGKKPIDMSQPPGRENLVSWARPLLTNQQDLQTILDPSLGPTFPFDSIAKVSAIASMCVQPEVSHRPFMGEVVQALKLVSDECIDTGSRVSNYEEEEVEEEVNVDLMDTCSPVSNYECGLDVESGYLGSGSRSDMFRFKRLEKQHSDSFRRHSSSGPLGKLRRFSRGAVSEHATSVRFWSGSH